MTHSSGVLGTYLKSRWIETQDFLLEIVRGVEGVVPDVDIASEREREFPMGI